MFSKRERIIIVLAIISVLAFVATMLHRGWSQQKIKKKLNRQITRWWLDKISIPHRFFQALLAKRV